MSQCTWSNDDLTCNLRPPPADAIYIIIVSLITLLLGIPPSIFVTILLDEYASKWPGKVEGEEELAQFAKKDADEFEKSLNNKSLSNSTRKEHEEFDEDCHESNDFGKAMRKASLLKMKTTSQSQIVKDSTMYTYCNGTYVFHTILKGEREREGGEGERDRLC